MTEPIQVGVADALNRMANPSGKLISAAQPAAAAGMQAAIFISWKTGAEATPEPAGERLSPLEGYFW